LISGISFEKELTEARLLDPSKGFSETVQTIERRKDPLLERWCRINAQRANRPKELARDSSLEELAKSTEKGCFFCPASIESSTPKFPPSLAPEGRIRVGASTVFPNLFPFARHHAVVAVSEIHYVPLERMEAEVVGDALRASLEYARRLHEKDPESRYLSVNWNWLPTAAASLMHPHFQVVADVTPTKYVGAALAASRSYFSRNGSSFWSDLCAAEEAGGERFAYRDGAFSWVASFAPMGNNEVVGIADGASELLGLGESGIGDLARGLSKALKVYSRLGVQGLNMAVYSGPLGQETGGFSLHVRLISRPKLKQLYTSDAGFMERLHDEVIVETWPEDVARELRA
jgi:galactose-1-phosphate uridylyltransferase